jgi:hypothetical protein
VALQDETPILPGEKESRSEKGFDHSEPKGRLVIECASDEFLNPRFQPTITMSLTTFQGLKGWRRRFNSVPGHHHSKALKSNRRFSLSPLFFGEVRFRSGIVMIVKNDARQ